MTPPLVLLHPFPFDSTFWDPVVAGLPGVDVTTVDAPGFGGRPVPTGWQISDWADDVAEHIAGLPGGSAVVCGLSMGGYAALALVAAHPDRVTGLVLADTRAEADSEEAKKGRDAGIGKVTTGELAAWADDLLPKLVSPSVDDAIRDSLRTAMLRQDPSCVAEALRALRDRPDRVGELGDIHVPTLIVIGEDDGVTPLEAAMTMEAGIPDARLETIAGAGHLSAAEQPQAFAAALREYLEGLA